MLKLAIDAKLAWPAVRPFFLAPLPAGVATIACLIVFVRPRIVAVVHRDTKIEYRYRAQHRISMAYAAISPAHTVIHL